MVKQLLILSICMILIQSITAQSLKEVKYADGTQELNGLVTSNAGKNLPGVLILPAWMGIDDEAKTAALQLEKEGYIVFVADIYGKGNIPTDYGSAAKIATQFKTDYQLYQKRISLALDQLKAAGAKSSKIVVIGYCFGGSGALETARAGFDVAGVVSIHGGLGKSADRPNVPIKTKVLVENPAEDKGVTKEIYDQLVQEMKDGKADWQIITYANCGHTFTNPTSKEYNEVMAKRAWNHTLLFLDELLK
jgi:dienelactone hydrolase